MSIIELFDSLKMFVWVEWVSNRMRLQQSVSVVGCTESSIGKSLWHHHAVEEIMKLSYLTNLNVQIFYCLKGQFLNTLHHHLHHMHESKWIISRTKYNGEIILQLLQLYHIKRSYFDCLVGCICFWVGWFTLRYSLLMMSACLVGSGTLYLETSFTTWTLDAKLIPLPTET